MRLKLISLFKVCLGVLAASAPMAKAYTTFSQYIWEGGFGNDYFTPLNWSPAGPPGNNDSALFSGNNPSVIINADGNAGVFVFQGTAGYTFSWGGSYIFNLEGTGITGMQGGVSNNSNQIQTFVVSQGNLVFSDSTSANFSTTNSPPNEVDYNIYGIGDIDFVNFSTAGSNTYINLMDNGEAFFENYSNAGFATITAGATSGIFFIDQSDAYESNITLNDNSVLQFLDSSNPDQANIFANNNSTVTFETYTIATSPGPVVYLSDLAQLNVQVSNQVASLESTSTGTVVSLISAIDSATSLQTNEAADVEDIYAGTITGITGSQLIMGGTGSLQLTQAMLATDYIWDAVANNGTLIGDSTNLDRNLQINEGGTVQFIQNAYGQLDLDNQLTNTGSIGGTLLVTGGPDGVLNIISDNSNFAGTVEVASADLAVNTTNGGVLGNGNLVLLVDPDGTLSGTGTVNGTVIVNGTISPGNSIGPFPIVGSYIQNAGSYYIVELDGTGDSDVIIVTGSPGTATLNGGTVVAESIDGTFIIGMPYTILTASGGVSGQYDNAIPNGLNIYLVPTLSYDSNDVYLTLGTGFEVFAENSNEYEVALQLDSIQNPSDALQNILQNLVTLSPGKLNEALSQMSGEQYTNLFEISQQSSRTFLRDLYAPLFLSRDFADDCCEMETCGEFDIWQTVHYGRSYLKGDHESKGFKNRSIDAALGIQTDINECWKAGLAAFYENDRIHYHLKGKARANIFRAALYGMYQNECYYGWADAVFGYSHYNLKRHIEFAEIDLKSHSTPKIYDGTLYFEGGLNYCMSSCLKLQPFFGVEAGYYWQHRFDEKGACPLNLKARSKHVWNCDTRLGLRVTAALPCNIIFSADAAWQHWYTEHDNTVHVRFKEFGDEFRVRGPRFKRNLIDASIYLGKTFCDNLTVFARAFGERSENYSSYSAAIGLDLEL